MDTGMETGENNSTTAVTDGRRWHGDDASMHRRHVLMAAGVLGSVTALTVAGADGAGTDAVTGGVVWRLQADWGYPRGPHGKTRLVSNASRRAAAHRYALTQRDAEAMNLHKCSFAPAVAVTVDAESFDQLWQALAYELTNPSTGQSVLILDDRHAGRIPQGTTLITSAFSPHPARPATAAPVESGSTAPVRSEPVAGDGSTTSTGTSGSPDAASPSAALALTGSTVSTVFATGVGIVAAGVAALRLRRSAPPD